jgi:hypothetical protein
MSITIDSGLSVSGFSGFSGSGQGGRETITQAVHGFSSGEALAYFAASGYARTKADSEDNAEALGVVERVVDANNFVLIYGGRISGLSGFSAATVYFISDTTSGRLTETAPSTQGTINKPMLVTTAATEGVVVNYRGATVGGSTSASLRGYIDGLTLANNGTDANNDVDIAAGLARDSSNTFDMSLTSTLTKRLDAAWAAGTNQGGLDTGAEAASTWYHVWLIRKDSDGSIDALFSTSVSAPTMPSGYTAKRRIGSVRNDASSNLLAFTQVGDSFLLASAPADVQSTTQSTTAVLYALSVPLGVKVFALISSVTLSSSGTASIWYTSPDQTDEAPTLASPYRGNQTAVNAVVAGFDDFSIRTNASSQIRVRSTVLLTNLDIRTRGWIDRRGKDS